MHFPSSSPEHCLYEFTRDVNAEWICCRTADSISNIQFYFWLPFLQFYCTTSLPAFVTTRRHPLYVCLLLTRQDTTTTPAGNRHSIACDDASVLVLTAYFHFILPTKNCTNCFTYFIIVCNIMSVS